MCKQVFRAAVLAVVSACLAQMPAAQQRRRVVADDAGAERRLSGVYRIDLGRSDRLYSVVAGASSNLPYAEQQKFFIDLTVRLTPPDQLAVERKGLRVRLASSRSPRIEFEADGVARSERAAAGHTVTTRAAIEGDRLTVNVAGGTDDRFSVTFAPLDGGRSLHVTRRIGAPQLSEPVVIHSVYEKISDAPSWDVYGAPRLATGESPGARERPGAADERAAAADRPATTTGARTAPRGGAGGGGDDWAESLRSSLEEWIAATNGRDIPRQMEFYAPTLQAFYLTRNVPRAAVRAEKQRVFGRASVVDIRADSPEIVLAGAGRTAVMRFRKSYRVEGGGRRRDGEVIQELRWRQTPAGWKITSERDVRVIR